MDQLQKLRNLIRVVGKDNAFYAPVLREANAGADLTSIDAFTTQVPPTTKAQLVADQEKHPPYGSNLSFPLSHYTRFHQTSGTSGKPMRWLDTNESWQSLLDCWQVVFRAAGLQPEDRVVFAFSFGPFLGFWTAFEAATGLGSLCLPAGGMTSQQRLALILDNEATFVCCTPTYALRLAEVAREMNVSLDRSNVRRIVVAGEPGGSIPSVRHEIEAAWPGASVFDHHGMTEVGPVTYENPAHPGVLHVIDDAYLPEVVNPATLEPVGIDEVGELLLTTLDRTASPLLRYRTGDLVRLSTRSTETLGTCDTALEGGILGRCDDMVVVKGNNVYPSAVDAVMRSIPGVAEYRVDIVRSRTAMTRITITVEPAPKQKSTDRLADDVARALQSAVSMRVPVNIAKSGELPRFEMKAKRWIIRDE